MNKHRYKTTDFKRVNWDKIDTQTHGQRISFAVDVAKEEFFAAVMKPGNEVVETIKWVHPDETRALGKQLKALNPQQLEVALEPSGTYGDSLRWYLRELGYPIYRVSPKRVHDAAEVYDGVPSLHDAKAAYLIGRLHQDGASEPWQELPESRREQQALIAELDLYQGEHRRNLNRLEAIMNRHWPEAGRLMELGRSSLLHLIAEYGSPQVVDEHRSEAERLMRLFGHGQMKVEKVQSLLDSAEQSLGLPCSEQERHYLQILCQELIRTHQLQRQLERRIDAIVENDPVLQHMAPLVGRVTSLVFQASLGSPLDYPNPHAYLKAFGLNLKEKSSGKHKGQLKITKRGPGRTRHYLYLAPCE